MVRRLGKKWVSRVQGFCPRFLHVSSKLLFWSRLVQVLLRICCLRFTKTKPALRRFIKDVQQKLKSHSWRCMPPNLQKPAEKMMTMLDPFGKSKRRVQKKYLVCRNGLKFEVIYIPHEITSWYQPTINPTKESCPCAMAGSCGSFVFPGRGAFPIPGAEFWVIFIHMF